MYTPEPKDVLATRQYLEKRADQNVTQTQLVKVAGPDLYVWMDEREGFPGNYLNAEESHILGRHILKYVLTDPELIAAYYQAVGLDPIAKVKVRASAKHRRPMGENSDSS